MTFEHDLNSAKVNQRAKWYAIQFISYCPETRTLQNVSIIHVTGVNMYSFISALFHHFQNCFFNFLSYFVFNL